MKRFAALLIAVIASIALAVPALAEPELVYYTEDLELHLPASWIGNVLIVPSANGASFYQKASYDRYMEKGLSEGGFLFSLGASVNSDFSEQENYIYLGFSEKSAMNYFLSLPTDYPAYNEDGVREEWDAMHAAIRGIAQGAVIYH